MEVRDSLTQAIRSVVTPTAFSPVFFLSAHTFRRGNSYSHFVCICVHVCVCAHMYMCVITETPYFTATTAFWRIEEGENDACHIVDGGRCVTDGPDNYERSEYCQVAALKSLVLTAEEYDVEDGYDFATVAGIEFRYSGKPPKDIFMSPGTEWYWKSDSSVHRGGYKICAAGTGTTTYVCTHVCMYVYTHSRTHAYMHSPHLRMHSRTLQCAFVILYIHLQKHVQQQVIIRLRRDDVDQSSTTNFVVVVVTISIATRMMVGVETNIYMRSFRRNTMRHPSRHIAEVISFVCT